MLQNPGDYFLEVCQITSLQFNNQYCIHPNKFQLHHTDVNVLDQNPYYIHLTAAHSVAGEIA
jgi:hypothetical protein